MSKIICTLVFLVGMGLAANAQEVKVVKWNAMEELISSTPEGELRVINFWATWCRPCIAEMPYFEAAHKSFADKGVKVYFISLDDPANLARVKAFIDRKALTAPVSLLDEVDFNSWIPKIDGEWSGAIPATLVVDGRNGQQHFYEKEFHEGELAQLIEELLK